MEEEITKIILDEQLNKINTNIYLTNKQIDVLENHHVPYKKCHDLKELLFILEDFDDEELDEIASQISEFDYYNNINK